MADSTGYYEVYKSGSYWRWRFKANNHEIIASGESYYNKADCVHAVELMKGSWNASVYDA